MRFGVSRIEGGSPGSRAIKDSRDSSTSRELARTKGTVDSFQYSDFSAKIPKIDIFITEIAIGRWEFISKVPGGLGGIRAANTGTPCELGIRFRDGGFVDFGKRRFSKIPINWPSAPALRIFEFAAALPRPRATASRTTTYQTFPIQDESYRQVLRRA